MKRRKSTRNAVKKLTPHQKTLLAAMISSEAGKVYMPVLAAASDTARDMFNLTDEQLIQFNREVVTLAGKLLIHATNER